MFEDSEVGENMGKSSAWRMELVFFVAGFVVAMAIAYLFLMPSAKRAGFRAGEQAGQHEAAAELTRNPVAVELQTVKATLQATAAERDACKEKFDRQTILYDDSVIVDPGKEWIIPADIEPIILTNRMVSYTHYDPKNKRESVHFRPSKQ
jgi:hypothetical protein